MFLNFEKVGPDLSSFTLLVLFYSTSKHCSTLQCCLRHFLPYMLTLFSSETKYNTRAVTPGISNCHLCLEFQVPIWRLHDLFTCISNQCHHLFMAEMEPFSSLYLQNCFYPSFPISVKATANHPVTQITIQSSGLYIQKITMITTRVPVKSPLCLSSTNVIAA